MITTSKCFSFFISILVHRNNILKPDLRRIFALAYLFITVFNPIWSTCQNKHFLTFYGTNEGKVGHAFVSFVREDNNLQQTVVDGVWGLYPASRKKGGASYLIGEVPGEIRDDFLTRPDVGLTVEVTPQEYKNALDIKNNWSNANYRLNEKDSLCDYSQLIDKTAEADKMEVEKLYLQLIGLLEKLGAYRQRLFSQEHFIDVFPAVYFHTTAIEMDKIRKGNYNKPIWKMTQMINFYEAYEYNRKNWDSGRKSSVEPHWVNHFQVAEKETESNFGGCTGIQRTINTAIQAHVDFDLPRSIRYTNKVVKQNKDIGLIKNEFWEVNNTFSKSQSLSIQDIYRVSSWYCDILTFFGQYLIPSDIVLRREVSWYNAMNSSHVIEYNGTKLAPQPKIPNLYNQLESIGRMHCPFRPLPSLFLFDLSGSMAKAGASGQPKIKEAEEAAKKSLATIRNNADQGIAQSVSIRTFSGGCPSPGTDPSREVIEFTEDLNRIETIIDAIGSPGGGTPLKEAIEASEAILSKRIKDNNLPKGRLIILSDGQATCGSIRPNDVYAFGQSGKVERSIQGLRSASAGASPIKYYTVGFNIAPGSEAERDLKYLASISGGKYLNAQNQFQLTRAFQRFSQVFVPKPAPMQTGLPGTSTGVFNEGVKNIRDEYYRDALQQFKSFHQLHDQDCHGAYNLAVAYEANEYYKASMQQYENYLQLCPDASDRRKVQEKIKLLQKDYEAFLEFSKKVIESDRDYLKLHFKKIQNGESIALATEFIAFIKEKWRYYEKLPEILEMDSRMLEINAEAVFRGLKECASTIDRDPQHWDRNATPVLSRTYLNMDRLLKSF